MGCNTSSGLQQRMPSPRHRPVCPAGRRAGLRSWRCWAAVLSCLGAVVGALGAVGAAGAAPFTPQSDDEVVQKLPYRLDASIRKLWQDSTVSGSPAGPTSPPASAATLAQAVQAARDAIERSRQFGDPRELGLAQAVLAPWWQLSDPPAAVRLLRATVRQSQHDFQGALQDLRWLTSRGDAALPILAQAWLTQAALQQLQGQLAAAQASCQALLGPDFAPMGGSVARAAQVCLAEALSLQGRTQAAEQLLAAVAADQGSRMGSAAATESWIELVRAEIAERRGQDQVAGQHYARALAARPQSDVYTRAAYADWLLRQGQPAQVIRLLSTAGDPDSREASAANPGRTTVRANDVLQGMPDALALRQAIAWQQLGAPQASAAAAELQARFAEARQRGDLSHAREEARYLLDIRGQASAALRLAQAQWAQQKEPADALLLARAAVAAGQPQALAPLLAFVRDVGWVDARLGVIAPELQR